MDYANLSADTASRLKLLIDRIDAAKIPASKLDVSLNIATWNIRDFGKTPRTDDAILFIAQILYQFDLIAITELRDDVQELKRVLQRLGPHWKFVMSDWQADAGGNWERTAYLYDKRMVAFTGLAAEAQPNRNKIGAEYISQQSWWRSPYIASFQAGSFDFIMVAMHARWGDEAGRIKELQSFGDWISSRWDDSADKVFDQDIIVVGDFNIPKIGDKFYQALTVNSKLKMPKALESIHDTAVSPGHKRYDQILHRAKGAFSYSGKGGIIDFSSNGLMEALFKGTGIAKNKLTWQLSDHFPLWVQIKTDNDVARLDSIIQQG
ncbi:endonuclease/exonuclease/phosphatase family protein [Rheinheimera texasensis]|uniref:endonuclease/exonuclease/phosphatase family protein n=1 Tax=Rheinheimera texasensis TaxID=306205 RepID=UPI0004E1AB85|nr:endonuclease/exonuclease/phosphatase family protein [Rheinheimera texasensis]